MLMVQKGQDINNWIQELKELQKKRLEKVMTQEQKNCIQELDVYFKMKEAECEKVMNKSLEEAKTLQKPGAPTNDVIIMVNLYYKNYRLFYKSIPEGFPYRPHTERLLRQLDLQDPLFISDIPVCLSLYKFWLRCCRRDMSFLNSFAQDIPNRLENILCIVRELRVRSTF